MIAKIFTLVLLFLIGLLATPNISAQERLDASELVGSYYAGHNFGGSSIKLKADGNYSEGSGSCTFTTEETGKYVLSDGVLRYTILKYTGKQNGDEQEVDLFNSQNRKEFFGYHGDEEDEPLRTEFSMFPIKWGERFYLIYESDLKNFSNAVNLGLEPRTALSSEPYYGSFFLRESDLPKSVSGKPLLPVEWQSFLLNKPVTAKIVAMEVHGGTKIATINKGSRDDFKVGMKLLGEGQEPSPWGKNGEVLSVEERTAKVQVDDLNIGDILSSKYISSNPLYR